MSDAGRKDFSSQVQEKVTPDSQKSTTEKAGETLSGAGDRVASAVTPQDQKSTSQKVGDSVRGGSDNAENQGKSMLDQASESVSSGLQSAQEALGLNQQKK